MHALCCYSYYSRMSSDSLGKFSCVKQTTTLLCVCVGGCVWVCFVEEWGKGLNVNVYILLPLEHMHARFGEMCV